VRIFFTH